MPLPKGGSIAGRVSKEESMPRSGRTGKGEQEKVPGRKNTGQEQEQGWLTQETARKGVER